jgi:hypothetical protein
MDASDAVATLHRIDPDFRDICAALYPGLEPREVADAVYGVATNGGVAKGEPDSADVHVPTTNWRNGRGHTKGRGRRKIDTDVTSTRFVAKAVTSTMPGQTNHSGAARKIGLATTAVGTGISAVSLPKHLKHLPAAMKNAKTGPSVGEGIKSSVRAVRQFSKPEGDSALKGTAGAVKAGLNVARENPRISAGLLLGATAVHTANLGGEAIATHVLHSGGTKPPTIDQPDIHKSWATAQAMLVQANRAGLITKAEALRLGRAVYTDLAKTDGHEIISGNLKLTQLKAPPPVKVDQPKLSPTRIGLPKPGKSGAGSSGKTSNKSVKKSEPSIEMSGEISKLNEDKQQCFGWCSVVKVDGKDVVDKQNDLIDIDDLETSAYDYMLTSRKGGDMHRRASDGGVHHVADVIESFVLTPEKISKMGLPDNMQQGWWIGMQVHDDGLWDDVKSGRKRRFSVHGTGKRSEVLVDA